MEINIQNKPAPQPNRGRVVVSRHPVRERVMIDRDGNEIDPKTKQIIKRADQPN